MNYKEFTRLLEAACLQVPTKSQGQVARAIGLPPQTLYNIRHELHRSPGSESVIQRAVEIAAKLRQFLGASETPPAPVPAEEPTVEESPDAGGEDMLDAFLFAVTLPGQRLIKVNLRPGQSWPEGGSMVCGPFCIEFYSVQA